MMRRMFLKLFGGASAAAAVTVGPQIAEAVQKAKEDPITSWPVMFNQRKRPRNVEGVGFSADLLYSLGFVGALKRSDLLRLDEIAKSCGAIPVDAVLEDASLVLQQDVLVFRYRHPSFTLVRGGDCISLMLADDLKFKRFFKRG